MRGGLSPGIPGQERAWQKAWKRRRGRMVPAADLRGPVLEWGRVSVARRRAERGRTNGWVWLRALLYCDARLADKNSTASTRHFDGIVRAHGSSGRQ